MAEKKLTKTQKMILSRAADKPLLNYGDFGDAQRRTIDKAADLLEEWGMIEHKMGTGWHITPAGLAAIGRTSAAPEAAAKDAPAMELCRTPPLYMEMANMNGGLVGAQQLEIEELRQEVAKLLKSEQEDEYIDEPILSKPLYTVTVDNCCGEVEALREENTALKADRVRNLARNTALEDALKPFAALAHEALKMLPEHSRPEYTWYQFNDVSITVAHLRAVVDVVLTADALSEGE